MRRVYAKALVTWVLVYALVLAGCGGVAPHEDVGQVKQAAFINKAVLLASKDALARASFALEARWQAGEYTAEDHEAALEQLNNAREVLDRARKAHDEFVEGWQYVNALESGDLSEILEARTTFMAEFESAAGELIRELGIEWGELM